MAELTGLFPSSIMNQVIEIDLILLNGRSAPFDAVIREPSMSNRSHAACVAWSMPRSENHAVVASTSDGRPTPLIRDPR